MDALCDQSPDNEVLSWNSLVSMMFPRTLKFEVLLFFAFATPLKHEAVLFRPPCLDDFRKYTKHYKLS